VIRANVTITKPGARSATPVRTQASKVRSLAR
jgi:hypothetical protein